MAVYFVLAALTVALVAMSRPTLALVNQAATRRDPYTALRVEESVDRQPGWTPWDLIAVGLLVTFSAVRFNVGTDFGIYTSRYEFAEPSYWHDQLHHSPQEIGYTVLNLLVRSWAGSSPHWLMWITSAVAIIPAYAAIKRHSNDQTMSVLLYMLLAFYLTPLNLVRQGMAVGLVFWAHRYIDRRRWLWLLIVALASTLHITAAVAAVIQFIAKRLRPSWWLLAASIAAGVAGSVLVVHSGMLGSLLSHLNSRYEDYLQQAQKSGTGTYLIIVTRVVLIAYAISLWRRHRDAIQARYVTWATLGLPFLIMGTKNVVLSRLELYFGIYLVLALPNLMRAAGARLDKLVLAAGASVYFAFFLSHYASLIPYHTYFAAP